MAVARESGLIVGQAVSHDCGLDTLQAVADTRPQHSTMPVMGIPPMLK
jgi:hypothetical protein